MIAPIPSEEEFNTWKHHPVTRRYRTFLEDYRAWLIASFHEHWMGGMLDKLDEGAVRGRVLMLSELADIEHQAISDFYQQRAQNDETAVDNPEDRAR